jgi:hypothetical protein
MHNHEHQDFTEKNRLWRYHLHVTAKQGFFGIQTPQDNFILHKTLIELNYMLMNRFMDFITFMRFQRKLHSHTLKIPVVSVPENQQ